jgi:hypothetical protein
MSGRNYISYLLTVTLFTAFTFTGCKEKDNRVKEGYIDYDVTYPYFKDPFMKNILPSKMSFVFKNGMYKNTIEKAIFSTSLISNCNDSILVMTMRIGQKQYYSELDAALTDTMISKNGIPDIINLNTTDSIAGKLCYKHMGVFDNLNDGYDVEVYETKEIGIDAPNWSNPYRELDGVLLGYEVDQFGLQMRFRATQITDTIVNDSTFQIPANYKKVPLERMLYEIEELFNSL